MRTGHRNCEVVFNPGQTRAASYLCPDCGKPLVVGVMHRVETLADRPEGFKPEDALPCFHLVPLEEILADVYRTGVQSKRIRKEYLRLVERGGSEFTILLDLPEKDLAAFMEDRIVEGILRVRRGRVTVRPGYDGVYGKVDIFGPQITPTTPSGQLSLF